MRGIRSKIDEVFKEKLGIEKDIMIERARRTKRNYKYKKIKVRSVQEKSC